MKVNLADFRTIVLLVDEQKNIVIFPISKSDFPIEFADGSFEEFGYLPAYYPIELKYPYDTKDLAKKIECGIEQWDKHPCYQEKLNNMLTFEEKYYGIKGFKKASKGKLYIRLGWDDIQGKYITLCVPAKRGYAYFGLDDIQLPKDADWSAFADEVIKYVNMDITRLDSFKTYESKLNL